MKPMLVCTMILSLAMPGVAEASFRRAPLPLPQPRTSPSTGIHRGGWDTRAQDKWDRQLNKCLNDRHQSRRERRDCADMGMPVRR